MKRHDEWNAIQGASKAVDVATRLDRMVSQPDLTLVWVYDEGLKKSLVDPEFVKESVCSNFDPPNRAYTSSMKKNTWNQSVLYIIYTITCFVFIIRENCTVNEWCLCLDDSWWFLMILDDFWWFLMILDDDDSWCLCLEIHSSLTFSSKDKPSPNRHDINWSPLIHIDYGV